MVSLKGWYDGASGISYYCPYDGAREVGRVFIASDAALIGVGRVYLFVLQENAQDACGRNRPLIKEATFWSERGLEVDQLEVRGIHKFAHILEHELAHRRHHESRIMLPSRGGPDDRDRDWLRDSEELRYCLDPCRAHTTRAFPRDLDGDADVLADIEAYGKLDRETWQADWADTGLQKGVPVNPFPWKYRSTQTRQPPNGISLLRVLPSRGPYSPCSCP